MYKLQSPRYTHDHVGIICCFTSIFGNYTEKYACLKYAYSFPSQPTLSQLSKSPL